MTKKIKNVLCVAVHPDDETLGCGGALLKHKENGDSISCLWVTNGNLEQQKTIPIIKELYGFRYVYTLQLPDAKLDELPLGEIVSKISKVLHELEPDTLYIPNRHDAHSDHRVIYSAVAACTKPFRYPYLKEILMMEVMSETDAVPALQETVFCPNVFIDISEYFEKKIEIMKTFESELLPYPQTRNLEALHAQARSRGYPINVEYAEAFMLVRSIR
jgi:LmbE family N-acetylglucosaminyl deacetylase